MKGLVVGAVLAVVAGCDGGFDVKNGRPRVTWVAVEAGDQVTAMLTLWVQDPEGDAVDVAITWSAGGASGPVVLAPGSAPLSGVPTQLGLNDDAGQPHRVVWDIEPVPDGAVTLTIVVDDRPFAGDDGDTYRVDGIDPRADGGPFEATR